MKMPALVPEFHANPNRILWVVRSVEDGLVICNSMEEAIEMLKDEVERCINSKNTSDAAATSEGLKTHSLKDYEEALSRAENAESRVENCKVRHIDCMDCSTTMNFEGKGVYECWHCRCLRVKDEVKKLRELIINDTSCRWCRGAHSALNCSQDLQCYCPGVVASRDKQRSKADEQRRKALIRGKAKTNKELAAALGDIRSVAANRYPMAKDIVDMVDEVIGKKKNT